MTLSERIPVANLVRVRNEDSISSYNEGSPYVHVVCPFEAGAGIRGRGSKAVFLNAGAAVLLRGSP